MTDIDFPARLLEIARAQAATKAAEAAYDAAMRTVLDPLKNAVAAAQNEEERLTRKLRDDTLAYVQETGDLTPHPSVTFRRSKRWEYSSDEALAYVREHELDNLYVATVRLNVRAFEKALKDGELPDFDAEEVPAPTVAIGKLGDLLIMAEMKAREDGEK